MAAKLKTYRMEIPAVVCCDIKACSVKRAKELAYELAERLNFDGIDLENVDTEESLLNAVVYPNKKPSAKVLDVTVEDT